MPQCNALTNHMCVTVTGSWRPCCRFNKFDFVDIEQTDFESYRYTDFYQNIIKDMSNGWSEGCKKCMKEEERGQTSLRQVINSFTSGGPDVEYIEISLSNQCNLACKMCSPSYSTFWHKIVRENPQLKKYHQTKTQPEINVEKIFSTVKLVFVAVVSTPSCITLLDATVNKFKLLSANWYMLSGKLVVPVR